MATLGDGVRMPIDERWEQLTPAEWQAFARAWLHRKLTDSDIKANTTGTDDV